MMLAITFTIILSTLITKLKFKYLNKCLIGCILGIILGAILHEKGQIKHLSYIMKGFSQTFIYVLLPFIIFESTFHMKVRVFFKNIGAICIFAFIGTVLNAVILSLGIWGISFSKVYEVNNFYL